ncbi:uncharacterized protein LOC144064073 isoform X2 [Vanacampus margaritifer]
MFRRSRFSVRPNVGGAGRTAAPLQEAVPISQETKEAPPKDVDEIAAASAVTDSQLVDVPAAKATPVSDGNDPSGDGTGSSSAVQRRKRFSVKPRVAPGRLTAPPRTQKSPTKVGSENLSKNSDLEPQIGTEVVLPGVQSPKSPEPIVVSCDGSTQAAAVSPDHSQKGTKKTEKSSLPSDDSLIKVPPRPPDKETAALSEKAKTLLSSKSRKSSIPRFSLSRLLNDPSDIQRLEKAQKLRDLLRQEMRKEKGAKRAKRKREQECNLDPAKMTMRDLIRYLPTSDPTLSSLEDETQENETVVPVSPRREKSPERVPKLDSEVIPKAGSQAEEEQEEAVDEDEDEEDDGALMVPRVKVAEDGTLILDEESLTVEVQRAKGPNPAEGRDPIFERGSTTTYSSFRASSYCKPWTNEETDMFFLAISMVGTDFSMIGQLFHNRTRTEIRNKFKKEERQNSWRIDKAFRLYSVCRFVTESRIFIYFLNIPRSVTVAICFAGERRKLDIEYFTKLLQKILEVQANRKKLKSLVEKNAYKKRRRSSKGEKSKKFVDHLNSEEEDEEVDEEEEEEMDGFLSSEAEDGKEENDELRKGGKALAAKAGQKRKLQSAQDVSAAKLKKSKVGGKSGGEDDACTPEDTEAALPEDQPDSQVCESPEMCESSERAAVKPAKLSRARAAKPVLPLGRKWSKKLPPGPTATKAKGDAIPMGDEYVADEASTEQINKETMPPKEVSEADEEDGDGAISSGDDDYSSKPAKPTRYGRVPKPPSHLNYPAKEEGPTSKPEQKCTAKRTRSAVAPSSAPASKKSKLITLRASQSESSEDEEEQQVQQVDEEEAFVPACLRSPLAVIQPVDETMEELDILGNMSDVLDISQDELCPDSLCEGNKSESGVREPCVHQLDLLVDVIDLMSSEHAEVSEAESFNEAAQTLLAIGNVAHLSQSETTRDPRTETESESVNETNKLLEEEIAEFIKENSSSQIPTADHGVTQMIETSTLAPTNTGSSAPDPSPQTRRGNASKVKPKPNLARASRTARSKSEPDASPVKSPTESCSLAPVLSKETTPMEGPYDQASENQTCDFTEANFDQAAVAAKPTDVESGHNYVAASNVAESQTDGSNAPLLQEIADHDVARQETLKCQKPSEAEETRSRFPKVKSKPNQSQISRTQSKPQTSEGTSPSPNLESTSKTTAEVEPQPASLETPGQNTSSASTLTPLMNLSGSMMQSGEKMVRVGHAAGDVKSTDDNADKSGGNTKAASEPKAESKTHSVQEGREFDAATQEQSEGHKPREVQPTRRSRFVGIKPNISHVSRNAQSKPKTTKGSRLSEVEPQPSCARSLGTPAQSTSTVSNATPVTNVSSGIIHFEELGSGEENVVDVGVAAEPKSTNGETVKSGRNNETAEVSKLEAEKSKKTLDLLEGQKTSEVVSTHQTRRSRFPKVKPKPNLETSRNAQDKLKMSPSLNLESARETTADVQPQPTNQITSPATTVTAIANVVSDVIPSEELNPVQKIPGTGRDASATKSKDCETVESGRNNETISDATVTEPQAEESNKSLDPKDGDPDSTLQELPECQNPSKVISRRSRFPKAKPNLPQTSRSSPSKSQTTEETAEVESQRQKPSQSARNPMANLSSTVTPSDEITSSEETVVGLGPDTNKEDSKACEHTRETIQRLPKAKPNLGSVARATQSKNGLDKPADGTSDGKSVSASSRGEGGSKSALSVTDGRSSETPATDSETSGAYQVTAEAQTRKCTDDTSLPKTSTMRRGRLVKPKPNVGQRLRQSGQVTVKAGPVGARGQATVALTPLEGAVDQVMATCSTRAPEHSIQVDFGQTIPFYFSPDVFKEDSATSTRANRTSASLPVFADTLSVPSDPDEPFFILSLMEVPLDASPPRPPRADLSLQHSLPVDSAVAGTAVPCGEIGVAAHPVLPAPAAASEDTPPSAVSSPPQRARGKAASCRPKVSKRATGKRPTASTAAPQLETAQSTAEPEPLAACTKASRPPSPPLSSIEVSPCHRSNSSTVQEEPTNVSQYFLSDIFTEVNET